MDALNRLHAKMLGSLRQKGGEIDSIFFCPHGPEDGCRCRKPMPGMFEDIAERLKINLNGVYAVGDSERDIEAARAVHAQPILVRTGKGERTLKNGKSFEEVSVFADLSAFADALLSGRRFVH